MKISRLIILGSLLFGQALFANGTGVTPTPCTAVSGDVNGTVCTVVGPGCDQAAVDAGSAPVHSD